MISSVDGARGAGVATPMVCGCVMRRARRIRRWAAPAPGVDRGSVRGPFLLSAYPEGPLSVKGFWARRTQRVQGGNHLKSHEAGRWRMGSMAAPFGAHAGSTKGYRAELTSHTSRCSSGMSGDLISRSFGAPASRPGLGLA